MIVLICCIVIFITYLVVFGLLTYYFIKHRTLLNNLFSIDKIIETLTEIFACPEHFIIYIPGILFETTPCVEKTKARFKLKDKMNIILKKINNILKTMKNIGLEYESLNNDINKMKWILGGTMDNFNHMYEETADFYNKLSGSYNILNETEINKIENNKIENNTKTLMTLEKIVLIENNIEQCDTILLLLNLINNKDIETLFQINNNYYMLCLIYNLIESVRIYKLKMYKQMVY